MTVKVSDGELNSETSFVLTVGLVTYAVSGQVTYYSSGIPVSGVIITLTNPDDPSYKETAVTDIEGKYFFSAVRSENSYICTPSKPGDPDSRD